MGQAMVPIDLRAEVSAHGFWEWGTTTMFGIRIFNLEAVSCLPMTSKKALVKAENQKK